MDSKGSVVWELEPSGTFERPALGVTYMISANVESGRKYHTDLKFPKEDVGLKEVKLTNGSSIFVSLILTFDGNEKEIK